AHQVEQQEHTAHDHRRPQEAAAVFPELALHQPVHFVQSRGFHAWVPFMVATNRSLTDGRRISPSASSCARATPSNRKMLLPNTWRSSMGFSARASAVRSAPTISSAK